MAAEADKVVVELVAENAKFDAAVKQSAAGYQQGMRQIETAGAGAEKAHGRLTASVGNSRIAMMEFQHIARGTADQIAAGAPLTQVLAQHMGMLGQAVSLAGGTFGKFGAFLGGPWGLALTVAAAGVATLILRHKEETDTVDSLIKKLQEHHDKTALNAEANDIWKHSIDGVIESEKSLADQLEKSLIVQSVAQRQALENAQALVALRALQVAKAEDKFGVADPRALKAQEAFHQAVRTLQADLLKFGEQEGAALSSLSDRASQWADKQTVIVRSLQTMHPELTAFGADINAAFDLMKRAVADAAGADVPFDDVTRQVDALNNKLAQSPGSVREYVAELRKLAAQLEATAEAAKKAGNPIADFKAGLTGAEGTGPNRMGSSAAGIGQFMPDTWMKYFKQAYPDQAASLSREAILDLRNRKEVAVGVIDVATKDYVAVLESAGQKITAAALYTMHMLSAGDPKGRVALRLLTAPDNQSARSIVGNAAANQNGNIFTGTAAQARAAIAKRIGDSSGAVSQGAVAIQRELDGLRERESNRLFKELNAEQEVQVVKEHQVQSAEQYLALHTSIKELIDSGILPSLEAWEKQFERIKVGEEELRQVGADIIDTVLNPDNWRDWGDMAHRVLREVELEILKLGAINPLKNLLLGQNNPTLGGLLGKLFGGGSSFLSAAAPFSAGFGTPFAPTTSLNSVIAGLPPLPRFAGGGALRVNGGVDTNLLSINGQPRAMVSGDETVAVIPNNARAIAPGHAVPPGYVYVRVEPSPYFDGRVMEVSGPVIARAAVGAANGGATIGRRNLAREAQHRLE
jgi:hypothetical protein